MEKGEESTRPTGSATRPTSSATRPASSTAMTQEIPRPFYPDWSAYNSYMHGYHGMMPPTFFPPFAPRPNADPYSWRNELPTGVPFRPPIAYPYAPPIPYPGCSSNSKDMTEPSSSTRPEPSSSTRRSLFSSESNTYEDSSNVGDEDIEQEQEFDNPMVEEVPSMVEEVPSIVEEVPSSSHGNDDDGVIEPRPGMSFKTEHELLDFYKKYGKQIGFGVMTQRSKREDDGSVRYLTLGCARGGKARNRTSNVSKPRPTTKTDCKAKINAIVLDGVLRITTVDNAHNHGLSPRKARFFRCNRAIDASVKRQLDINDKAGISMAKSFNSLVVEVGGYDNLPFVEKDARNYIDKARHLRLGKGGADALRGYFERMQYKNDGFYSLMDLDDEGRLKNVFWADARSRSAYGYFGDVVTFDTTYLTNRYGMPFAPFVGVNHHGQSILFGAGLISSEDTDTFVWLFETWLKCMDKRAPNAIITDQDRAMKNAIAIVFPKTRHRYCLWHIMRKLPEKLGSHSKYNDGLKSALHKCVYDCQTSEEFEKSWEVFLDTYNLHENVWLQSLYSERMHWVPVYLKDTFWAGMSTTQRSESINAFFDGFVHSGTTLKEFVDQFDNALRKRGENEMAADFHSFNCTIPCITHLPMEKQFQELYTNSKFKEVQSEVMGIIYSHCILIKTEGAISTYQVNDQLQVEGYIKRVTYQAYFNEEECEAKCMCGLFQMRGILCRHILAIFSVKDVQSVPSKYIMDRWRKDIKRRYSLIRSSYDDLSNKPAAGRYTNLIKLCYEVATNAAESDHFSMDMTQKLLAMNLSYTKTKAQPVIVNVGTEVNDVEMGSSKKVLSPRIVRGKGRPPSKRLAPTVEKVMRKQQTKRKQSETGAKRKRKNAPELQDEVSSGAPTTDEVFSTSGVAVTTDEVLITSGVQAVTDEILNTSGVQAATTDEVVFPGTQQSVISQVDLQHG
ncbi:protein FAR1-RELATED SEQUENCE 5-like isoform X1 [Juglans regia]|nr:protein FAR1-RELATED SEQUENCE 5-like isoform X1 [Juglans regia]XP_018826637.1 protein FAR1-RELATED SEQUENCE 5-like isoform X1 [Juglans regia]XP_035544276.1 protein FAR1-RELATED SEQUENCE 5-like isoform X1 [Juglans regia]XP_035544277.1 protein FAR1-RELATED SEQUENCE 5-like isoform X1 [Juglans regia]